jgi:hypothetical protein
MDPAQSASGERGLTDEDPRASPPCTVPRKGPCISDPILILTTGGAIDKQYFDALSQYQITDTMTLTARALSRCRDKTIVLTGALTPARFSESDAAFNLGMAFATAQTAPAGVYITINGGVFRGDEVVKDRERGCFVVRPDT